MAQPQNSFRITNSKDFESEKNVVIQELKDDLDDIDEFIDDETDKEHQFVYIGCGNCNTLHDLSDNAKQKNQNNNGKSQL